MGYGLDFHPHAVKTLESVPSDVRGEFDAALDRLSVDPDVVSEPACVPFLPIGHVYHFKIRHGEQLHYVRISFLYGDEGDNRLKIRKITIDPRFDSVQPESRS